jgi:hypothetical protein
MCPDGARILFLEATGMVATRGGRVVTEVPRTLARLAAITTGRPFAVFSEGSPLPAFDLH